MLFEARPLFYLADEAVAEFEVGGLAAGNRTIDWRFSQIDSTDILLEVKYRTGDLVEHFAPLIASLGNPNPTIQWKPARPEPLFASTYEKFRRVDPTSRLQGAWIHANVKVERSKLQAYFAALPENLLHFAVLSTWQQPGFLLSREGVDRHRIVRTFGLVESDVCVVDELADDAADPC